ncbi:hypothetical protein OOU_Y34scaffold00978g2 [Pyricularia oryzae Y34]|uniref:Uncharacterized protein n=2 Tax=Pyricularia oryzae TaxID=318829 RepID=A0AA97NNC9_PYRO3|nr:hypothetical protein OOU_Y34scaffold00978g2 [Pyricularia oryzae Y34]
MIASYTETLKTTLDGTPGDPNKYASSRWDEGTPQGLPPAHDTAPTETTSERTKRNLWDRFTKSGNGRKTCKKPNKKKKKRVTRKRPHIIPKQRKKTR